MNERERLLLRLLAGVLSLAALYSAVRFGVPEYRRRTLGSVTHEEMTRCAAAADCVAVGCEAGCSGCGGISYDEIVNRRFEGAWYYQKRCAPPGEWSVSPMVCCTAGEIVCSQGRCGYRLSESTNPHLAAAAPESGASPVSDHYDFRHPMVRFHLIGMRPGAVRFGPACRLHREGGALRLEPVAATLDGLVRSPPSDEYGPEHHNVLNCSVTEGLQPGRVEVRYPQGTRLFVVSAAEQCGAQDIRAFGLGRAVFGFAWNGYQCGRLIGAGVRGAERESRFRSMEECQLAYEGCVLTKLDGPDADRPPAGP
ncbi:MAG: hypothetical protein HY928_01650 [Elusimicrobia bacterium]|nr:hypothetical protein [Elusimicrobiota bacterium]